MQTFNQQEVSKRFQQLPEMVQELALSDPLCNALESTIASLELSETKALECNEQITLVLVGLSRVEDLEEYVKTDLGFDTEKTATFMNALRTGVLTPMRQALLTSLNEKQVSPQPSSTVDPYLERPQ
jgi:hypothetical protein